MTTKLLCTILTDIVPDTQVLDVPMPPHTRFIHSVILGYTVFAFVVADRGGFAGTIASLALENGTLVAWQGPMVINTQAEFDLACQAYRDGLFIRHGAGSPR